MAIDMFRRQYRMNPLLAWFSDLLGRYPERVDQITSIPFLPISFYKTSEVVTGNFRPEAVFTSSGTTGSAGSRHLVERLADYRASFTEAFRLFYGDPSSWCILALLPSYLERKGSSLVLMADELISRSAHPSGGFFLHDNQTLKDTLHRLEQEEQRTLLLGVTYALMDFADAHPMRLRHTVVMETGGMKGRRRELTRQEVHAHLKERLGLEAVHSEYGMTELLSQAYSHGEGIFRTPPWMRILIRAEDDPLLVTDVRPDGIVTGAINVIDLANRSSCAFIATDDLGRLHPDGSFEVIGRLDNSDIRGCSLMYA